MPAGRRTQSFDVALTLDGRISATVRGRRGSDVKVVVTSGRQKIGHSSGRGARNTWKLSSGCRERPTETVTEENFFFKLSAFQERLLELYESQPEFILPETRRNEVLAFVKGGLQDLSITRTTIKWGIPVPGEAPHVFYVWFDALIAYLTGAGGPDWEQRGLWPADLHMIGKEITRFHAIFWPAFLMAIVAEGVLFSMVDPQELVIVGLHLADSREAAYTVGFFLFWALFACSSGITYLLSHGMHEPPAG